MRQVSIRTIGLIRSTSLSDLACRWFTSLWMIQSVDEGWKHRLLPLGLLSLIEMCLIQKMPRKPSWHYDRELKRVCLNAGMCMHKPGSLVALFPVSSARYWLVSQPICLLVSYRWCHSCEIPHLIPDGASLSVGLEAVMSPAPETGQTGCAPLSIWHCAVKRCKYTSIVCFGNRFITRFLKVSPEHS